MIPDPETAAIFDHLWDTRLLRVDTQLERIANTAYWLGRKLAKHEITKDDVDKRLVALCSQRDPESPDFPLALVPYDIAEATAIVGLRRGLGATS